ncbi:MAG TPA: hypothetical protein PLJ34_11185, partial [Hyphomicrobiales bacterium]|nr:hypothetical protein [Hyphomicrobiales bacterium]
VTLTPHANTDVDIPLSVAVTTVDRWGAADASSPLVTTLPHTIIVQADAAGDEPSVTGSASGVEDSLLRELFDSVGATGWRGECPRNLFDEHANDGAIRIPGRTRRQRRIIVTLLSLFGIAATVNSTSGK